METVQEQRVKKTAERRSGRITKEVETIFDHNPTEEELDEIIIDRKDYEEDPDDEMLREDFACRTREGYIKEYIYGEYADIDMVKIHLSNLFWYRKDMDNAYKYAFQMRDPQRRQDRLNLLGGF